jgi:hypothetical protein
MGNLGHFRCERIDKKIKKLKTTEKRVVQPDLRVIYEGMKDLQAEMRTAFAKLQEIIQMEDVKETE